MKIGRKMTLGFAASTCVTAVLGLSAFFLFRSVDAELSSLNGHSLSAVQHSTGVERGAFSCILEEKNYLLKPSLETQNLAHKRVAELLSYLDKLSSVAEQYQDEALASKVSEVRTVTSEWAGLYNEAVGAIKSASSAESVMAEKGDALSELANDYIAAKNEEYQQAKSALATVNRINAGAFAARVQEKTYMLTGRDEEFVALEQSTELLNTGFAQLEGFNPDPKEANLIAEAKAAVSDYLLAARSWKTLKLRLNNLQAAPATDAKAAELLSNTESQLRLAEDNMDAAGETVAYSANLYQVAKGKRTDQVAEAVFLVSDIAQFVPTIRLTARRYMSSQEPALWGALMNQLGSLQKLFSDLKELSTSQSDSASIDSSVQAIVDYKTAAEEWVACDDYLRQTVLPEMNRIGQRVLTTVQAAENDAWVDSHSSSKRVAGVVSTSKTIIGTALFAGCLLGALISLLITRSIVPSLKLGVSFSQRIAQGDLSHKMESLGSDELGQLALSMNAMVDGLRSNISTIAQHAQSLSHSSEELSSIGGQVSRAAAETSAQTTHMSAAAEQVGMNVGTVATSAEEMSASISQISRNAKQASKVAAHASKVAKVTNTTVLKLSDSSKEIGDVVGVITSIAEQTNLLALNATIEAARAGEAGKGFAVVASEVKQLARQTAEATEAISARIKSIQLDSKGAVDAIREISVIIDQINQIQTVIASSVEEQTSTTSEIAKNANQAAVGANEIAQNIASVSQVAEATTNGAGQTAQAAEELARLASELRSVVDHFRLV